MLRKFKVALIALAAFAVIGAGTAAITQRPAYASTSACTQGTWTGYCGTQTDDEATALSFDVYQQHAVVNNKVVGWRDEDGDQATDFAQVPFGGPAGKTFLFIYAPDGIASGLCVSEPYTGAGLVLRYCNGSAYQQFSWTANPAPAPAPTPTPTPSSTVTADVMTMTATTFGTLTNQASGDIIQANGYDQQLTGVSQPSTLTEAQDWAFQG